MDERLENLRSTKNPKARIKIMKGHFATSNSHLDTYIDMSTVKIRHNNAREAAKVLAQEYVTSTYVDTIVCCIILWRNDLWSMFYLQCCNKSSRHGSKDNFYKQRSSGISCI